MPTKGGERLCRSEEASRVGGSIRPALRLRTGPITASNNGQDDLIGILTPSARLQQSGNGDMTSRTLYKQAYAGPRGTTCDFQDGLVEREGFSAGRRRFASTQGSDDRVVGLGLLVVQELFQLSW